MAFRPDKHVFAAFSEMCSSIDTPRSLAAHLMLLHGEHLQLAQLEIHAENYLEQDYARFRDDYLVTEYLSKFEGLNTGVDTAKAALTAWLAAEDVCKATNDRIRSIYDGAEHPTEILDIVSRAQQKIEGCIGTHVKWSKMLSRFKWGPGATSSLKGEAAGLDKKLLEKQISVTHEALPLLRAAMATDYAWLRARGLLVDGPTSLLPHEFHIVSGSRGVTAKKNAKIDRFIGTEASGNVFLQLGFGGYIRQCLLRIGIDLNDQRVNQDLARCALVYGLATVDLRAASDTITQAAVWLLLPFSWASALSRLRSTHITLPDGSLHYLEKFSSMGNGYTFELESLIFWGLTEAVRDHMGIAGRVSVYGDDIICPAECIPLLTRVLDWFGFELNSKKTHFRSLFRESCGKHYFAGRDVTPVYQKKPTTSEDEFYRFYNRLLYHAVDRVGVDGPYLYADSAFRWVPKLRARFRRSDGRRPLETPLLSFNRVLDGGLCTDVRSLNHRVHGGFRCVSTLSLVFVPREAVVDDAVAFAYLFRFKPPKTDEYGWPGPENESLPYTGTITSRRQGRWVARRARFPEARELRWV
ncbi:RNA-directed RNA polymerase [ssRNA phage SRR6960507_5]|uniref:RNA-directed RNA polymerase n=1 Tax=ssRNA phage SRR6960507_5 TaxID=2786515 RepID=A0A8S5L0I9_9VIRU|nr:RNA-directed RNA polymerase [ssRNA phage SRR6960507_5]DAD50642.1 TPA_asm: RNA-directed RNA polymerase [ssRNA phage SRR6960507_5]